MLEINCETYISCAKVSSETVPDGEENPPPENTKAEVSSLLTCLVKLRVLINELIVDILQS
jgi:hypothetical protein